MSDNTGYQSPFPATTGLDQQTNSLATVSVVVPFYNEEECIKWVLEEIVKCQPDAEVVAVDDGSSDATWKIMKEVDGVTPLRLTENRGQSGALYAPADIQKLVDMIKSGDCDVACGRRAKRKDTWSKRVASKIGNGVRRTFIKDGIRDTGCSLKVMTKDHVDLLVPFNGLHRFLPAIFTHAGLKIAEVDVNHRERKAGESKYNNLDRAVRGVYDLVGVCWILRRKVIMPKLETK